MRKNDQKLFLDKNRLWEMLNLRFQGHSTHSLAILFGCDHSSIVYQCDKYGIMPQRKTHNIQSAIEDTIAGIKSVNGERINVGKSYAEYLKEAKSRNTPESKYPPNL